MRLLESLPRPWIAAHRGESTYAPENTLPAFELALAHGAHVIELDVHISADNVPVVIHDFTVNRTTGGSGRVASLQLKHLKRLDAGRTFSPSYAGTQIPALEEVFAAFANRTLFLVELKNIFLPGNLLAERVAGLVKKYALQDQVLIASFQPLSIARFRHFLPGVAAMLFTVKGMTSSGIYDWIARRMHLAYIGSPSSDISQRWLNRQHHLGRRVLAYEVDEAEEMRRLRKLGIDGIITNNPQLAKRVLEEK